jgi:aldose 1-epimerase
LWNPTNHCYFALDGVGTDITQQQVMVSALCYQPNEADMLPTQGWQPLVGTPFDLRKPTQLNQVLRDQHEQIQRCGGLNHAFLLDHEAEKSVVLASTLSKRQITMKTDAPSVILYSGNHFNNDGVVPDVPKWGGLTMEAQVAPEINSDWSDIALAPNTISERNVAWHFDY